jgi:hypothetical protein
MSTGSARKAAAARYATSALRNRRTTNARETALNIFAGKGKGADAARIIVGKKSKGFVVEDPELIRGRHNDVVIWFCENTTDTDITVELYDFVRRFTRDTPPTPVTFATGNPIAVAAGETALIHGKVNRDPPFFEFYKYKVRVIGGGKTHIHDPDLEIKP